MTDDDKKYLTEKVLGECWHEWKDEYVLPTVAWRRCINCKKASPFPTITPANVGYFEPWINQRTFTTMPDLITLFEAIHGADEFDKFLIYSISVEHQVDWDYIPWLFCLNAPDQIPERCKMVAEWVRERGK